MGRGAATEAIATPARRRGRPTYWTDERIEEKLQEIIAETGELPSMETLRGRGLGGMAYALGRKGIAFHAGRVGLPKIAVPVDSGRGARPAKERRTPRKWSDERIEAELRRLSDLNGGHFPKRTEFEPAGREGLRRAIERKGIRWWAHHLGLELGPGQDRGPYEIADARRDIKSVVAEAGRLLGEKTLRQLGYGRLAGLIARHGGTARFCAIHRIELLV